MPSTSASPAFWRIFFGISCAFIGALAVLLTAQGAPLLPTMLGAAALGAVFGVATGPRIPKRGEFGGACEIPLKVLRLGMLLGAAEGGLAGAFFGGASGAVLGLALGLTYGHIFAAYSWRIRQRARVYVLALLASAFVEALGALAIGVLDYLMWRKGFTPAVFPVALLASLALQPIANRRN